jgi:CspA family cold shock protein
MPPRRLRRPAPAQFRGPVEKLVHDYLMRHSCRRCQPTSDGGAAVHQLLVVTICCCRSHRNVQVSGSTSFKPLETLMATGTVKWFNPTKGYGFIQPQGGGQDVFVHISAVERAGLSTLNEGQKVEYEIVSNRGKSSAENLKVK